MNEGQTPILPVQEAPNDNFFPKNFFQIGQDEIWDDFPIVINKRPYKKRLPKAPISKNEAKAIRRVLAAPDPSAIVDRLTLKMTSDSERRMIRAFKETVRNGGDIRKALEAEGYSEIYIREPGRITRSKNWSEISDFYFPPNLLAKKNLQLLNHQDWHAVNAVLDRLHKLRGDFVRKVKIEVTTPDRYRQLPDKDLRNIIEGEIIEQVEDLDVVPSDPLETSDLSEERSEDA